MDFFSVSLCSNSDNVMNNKLLLKLLLQDVFNYFFIVYFFFYILMFCFFCLKTTQTHPPSQNNMNVCCCLFINHSLFLCFNQCGAGNKKGECMFIFFQAFTCRKKNNQQKTFFKAFYGGNRVFQYIYKYINVCIELYFGIYLQRETYCCLRVHCEMWMCVKRKIYSVNW